MAGKRIVLLAESDDTKCAASVIVVAGSEEELIGIAVGASHAALAELNRPDDPKTDTWQVTWINPGPGVVRTFTGRQSESQIVIEGKTGDGTPIRWIFSDIRPRSFHWRGEKRTGTNWRIYEELDANRK